MTVYLDETRDYPLAMVQPAARRAGTRWCHLWTDGEAEELHTFAQSIGLRLKWYQDHHRHFGHYDLTPSRRVRALAAGAIEVQLKEYLGRRWRDAYDGVD